MRRCSNAIYEGRAPGGEPAEFEKQPVQDLQGKLAIVLEELCRGYPDLVKKT